MMDHSYCRPWNWRPETSFMCPTKCLFVWRASGSSNLGKMGIVDITGGIPPDPAPVYDVDKARALMDESEKVIFSMQPITDDDSEDWETKISR